MHRRIYSGHFRQFCHFRQATYSSRPHSSKAPRVYSPNPRSNAPTAFRVKSLLKTKPSWPINVIKSASEDGGSSLSTGATINFLDDIWNLVCDGKLHRWNIEALLNDHGLDVRQLTSIARLLVIQRAEPRIANLGLDLLSTSADLGDEAAAFIIVDRDLGGRSTANNGASRYNKALAVVNRLATDDQNLQALVMFGKIRQTEGQRNDALKFYETAIRLHDRDEIDEDTRFALVEAYRGAGKLTLARSDLEDVALRYFNIAAFKYGDAESFYILATLRGQDHPEYVSLTSQAAISGQLEAAYLLGLWYSTEGDYLTSMGRKLDSYTMAMHWFKMVQDVEKLKEGAILHLKRLEALVNSNSSSKIPGNGLEGTNDDGALLTSPFQEFIDSWKSAGLPASTYSLEDQLRKARH